MVVLVCPLPELKDSHLPAGHRVWDLLPPDRMVPGAIVMVAHTHSCILVQHRPHTVLTLVLNGRVWQLPTKTEEESLQFPCLHPEASDV